MAGLPTWIGLRPLRRWSVCCFTSFIFFFQPSSWRAAKVAGAVRSQLVTAALKSPPRKSPARKVSMSINFVFFSSHYVLYIYSELVNLRMRMKKTRELMSRSRLPIKPPARLPLLFRLTRSATPFFVSCINLWICVYILNNDMIRRDQSKPLVARVHLKCSLRFRDPSWRLNTLLKSRKLMGTRTSEFSVPFTMLISRLHLRLHPIRRRRSNQRILPLIEVSILHCCYFCCFACFLLLSALVVECFDKKNCYAWYTLLICLLSG